MIRGIKLAAAALALGLTATVASAGTVTTFDVTNGTPHNGLGTYNGTLEYDDAGLLSVTLTNTSPLANGGFITGFLFNIDGDASASYNPITGDTFQGVTNEDANPFGQFEFGAAIGGNWSGGGSPNSGIAVGDSRTFTFNVTGSDAGSLQAADFFNELSTPKNQNGQFANFIVRFKGFENNGSDKVPGTEGTPIPLPAAIWPGVALLGGMVMKRRRGEKAA